MKNEKLSIFLFAVEISASTMFWLDPVNRWPIVLLFIVVEFLFRKTEGELEIPLTMKVNKMNYLKSIIYLALERGKNVLIDLVAVFVIGFIFAVGYWGFKGYYKIE